MNIVNPSNLSEVLSGILGADSRFKAVHISHQVGMGMVYHLTKTLDELGKSHKTYRPTLEDIRSIDLDVDVFVVEEINSCSITSLQTIFDYLYVKKNTDPLVILLEPEFSSSHLRPFTFSAPIVITQYWAHLKWKVPTIDELKEMLISS